MPRELDRIVQSFPASLPFLRIASSGDFGHASSAGNAMSRSRCYRILSVATFMWTLPPAEARFR